MLDFNPFRYEMRADPYSAYAKIREQGSVVWSERYHYWRILNYKEAQEVFRSAAVSSDISDIWLDWTIPDLLHKDMQPLLHFFKQGLLFSDAPYHHELKKILSPFFSPDALEHLKQKIARWMEQLLIDATDEIEVVEQIAKPLAYKGIMALLGISFDHMKQCQEWNVALGKFLNSPIRTPIVIEDALKVIKEQQHFFQNWIDQKNAQSSSLIGSIMNIPPKVLPFKLENAWQIISMLIAAGAEATLNLIGNSWLTLLKHPEQMMLLRQNSQLLNATINEVLRFDPPLQSVFRIAKEDFLIGKQTIKQADRLQIVLAIVNRDPEIFSHPDQFDITRHPNPHLAFGFGPHYCLGRFLGQMITEICIEVMLKKFVDIELIPQQLDWQAGMMLRALKKLWIRVRKS